MSLESEWSRIATILVALSTFPIRTRKRSGSLVGEPPQVDILHTGEAYLIQFCRQSGRCSVNSDLVFGCQA